MLAIKEYIDIKEYSSLHLGGQFRYFAVISSVSDLIQACSISSKIGKKIFILGGGSNVVFSDGVIDVLALKIEIKGFEIIKEDENYTDMKVGSGENWDDFVSKTVNMNLSGIELLSAIPGTVGATPVQNVGAYGSEVKDTILEVEVFEIAKNKIEIFSNKECKFGYRDSVFKNEAKGKYIITKVTYRFKKNNKNSYPSLSYPGIKNYFENKGIQNPSLKQIRDAVISIRKDKLPDPKSIPNVGSFFKNPIVINSIADTIKEDFPEARFFRVDNYNTKIPAGWLIENSGLKGKDFGNISVYNKNALVLVNNKKATYKDIISARDEIIRIVKDKFNIILEQEPDII
jgi:UDP-N-acetylmuramate dehydrogenase